MTPFSEFRAQYLDFRLRTAKSAIDYAILYGMIHAFYLLTPFASLSPEEEEEIKTLREDTFLKHCNLAAEEV